MFSCEFCEISKNTFFTEHIWATASKLYRQIYLLSSSITILSEFINSCVMFVKLCKLIIVVMFGSYFFCLSFLSLWTLYFRVIGLQNLQFHLNITEKVSGQMPPKKISPCKICQFLRTFILKNSCERLLLNLKKSSEVVPSIMVQSWSWAAKQQIKKRLVAKFRS